MTLFIPRSYDWETAVSEIRGLLAGVAPAASTRRSRLDRSITVIDGDTANDSISRLAESRGWEVSP